MKKYVILVSLGVVLIVAAVIGAMTFLQEPDSGKLVSGALQELNTAQSFRFTVVQHEFVGAQEKILADISGERSGKDIGLKGKLAGNDVEMKIFGEDFFNRDTLSQKWVQYPGIASTVVQQLFPVEFNPSTLIEFDETGEVVLLDEETMNGEKCWMCRITPRISQDSLNRDWTNFAATVYVGKLSHKVVCVIVTADHKKIERKMRLTLGFDDIGSNISIDKP